MASAGDLGSPLLPSDAALVQLKPLRPYAAGDNPACLEPQKVQNKLWSLSRHAALGHQPAPCAVAPCR